MQSAEVGVLWCITLRRASWMVIWGWQNPCGGCRCYGCSQKNSLQRFVVTLFAFAEVLANTSQSGYPRHTPDQKMGIAVQRIPDSIQSEAHTETAVVVVYYIIQPNLVD